LGFSAGVLFAHLQQYWLLHLVLLVRWLGVLVLVVRVLVSQVAVAMAAFPGLSEGSLLLSFQRLWVRIGGLGLRAHSIGLLWEMYRNSMVTQLQWFNGSGCRKLTGDRYYGLWE
jgi:hypothetical protein